MAVNISRKTVKKAHNRLNVLVGLKGYEDYYNFFIIENITKMPVFFGTVCSASASLLKLLKYSTGLRAPNILTLFLSVCIIPIKYNTFKAFLIFWRIFICLSVNGFSSSSLELSISNPNPL